MTNNALDQPRGARARRARQLAGNYLFAPERLEHARFVLRSYHPGDGELLREAMVNSYDHLSRFMEWATPELEPEEAERTVRRFRGRYLLAEDFVIGIFSPDERRLLGGTGFHLRLGPLQRRRAEIGMWVRASEAGRGLGSEALRAMLEWGFTEWPWERLVWECRASNLASARVAEKAGMVREGVLRGHHTLADGAREDHWLFSLLREEWREGTSE